MNVLHLHRGYGLEPQKHTTRVRGCLVLSHVLTTTAVPFGPSSPYPVARSPGALAAADLVPSDMDKVTWLLKSREAWEEEAAGFVVWLEHMDATCGRFGAKGASTVHSSSDGTASKSLCAWRWRDCETGRLQTDQRCDLTSYSALHGCDMPHGVLGPSLALANVASPHAEAMC